MKTMMTIVLMVFVIFCASMCFLAAYPLLMRDFELLWTICSLGFLLTWVLKNKQDAKKASLKSWAQVWTWLRTGKEIIIKNRQKKQCLSVEQLTLLRHNVQRLGLALHDLTPEMETARRTHFQMHGEAVPALILPSQNASLYAEFKGLTMFLNHFGFPHLESVRLQQKDLEFAQKWGQELETRLLQSQKHLQDQQQALDAALIMVDHVCTSIVKRYPAALNDPGYHRIKGALLVLEAMAGNSTIPCDQVQLYIPALQRDMETLTKQLKRVVA